MGIKFLPPFKCTFTLFFIFEGAHPLILPLNLLFLRHNILKIEGCSYYDMTNWGKIGTKSLRGSTYLTFYFLVSLLRGTKYLIAGRTNTYMVIIDDFRATHNYLNAPFAHKCRPYLVEIRPRPPLFKCDEGGTLSIFTRGHPDPKLRH